MKVLFKNKNLVGTSERLLRSFKILLKIEYLLSIVVTLDRNLKLSLKILKFSLKSPNVGWYYWKKCKQT